VQHLVQVKKEQILKVTIKSRMMGFVEKCYVGLFSSAQFGFSQKYSATLAITHLYGQI